MSKVSANYPSYSGSNVSIGGSNASTGVQNGVFNANYNMSDSESSIYNYALDTLASILPSLNTFDVDTRTSLKNQVDAYRDSGVQSINNLYNNSLSDLENNIASRFGNLDNSMFINDLNSLESERSKSVSSFAQDVLSKQSSLESDELTKRYALVNLLNGLSGDIYNKALSSINTSFGGSSSLNNYNSGVYDSLSSVSKTNSNATNAALNSLISGLSGGSNNSLSSLLSMFL